MNIGSKQILAQKNGTQQIFCLPKTLALEKMAPKITDWRESRSRLGLETEVYETLGLVSVSCEILNHVQSRSRSR